MSNSVYYRPKTNRYIQKIISLFCFTVISFYSLTSNRFQCFLGNHHRRNRTENTENEIERPDTIEQPNHTPLNKITIATQSISFITLALAPLSVTCFIMANNTATNINIMMSKLMP